MRKEEAMKSKKIAIGGNTLTMVDGQKDNEAAAA
jgi:hypothetical protein